MSIPKKWLCVLGFLFLFFLLMYGLIPKHQKCIIYFNITSFLISILFLFINILAEKQTPSKKMGYTLGAIGNKFLLSIIVFLVYFFSSNTKTEIAIAFSIYFTYFVVSYYFLFQLTKK